MKTFPQASHIFPLRMTLPHSTSASATSMNHYQLPLREKASSPVVNFPSLCPEIVRTNRRFPVNKMLRVTCAFVLFLLLANTATAQDQPTLAKDTLQITAFTVNSYKGNFDVWSWLPRMQFRVNGPIASGSQL
jgi:hypothetical protein